MKTKLETSGEDLLKPIEEIFLNNAAATTAVEKGDVLQKALSLVTFSTNTDKMKRWEFSAGVRVLAHDLPTAARSS